MGEKRDAYLAKLKTRLDEWNADINKLEAKASQLNEESKAQYRIQIENLRTKRTELEQKISDLRKASEEAWTDVKGGVEGARKALDEAIQSARTRFK